MTDKELKELVASLAVSQKGLQESQKELQESQKELQESQKELTANVAAEQQETAKQIRQVNKQLGEIGNKWGTFAEGMSIASITKILFEKFNIPTVSQNVVKRLNGETIEIDAFGYENSTINTAIIVEIKSHLKESAIEQLEETMANFPKFFPDHAGKKLYGMIACVHAPDSVKNILRKKGIYLTVLHDDIFELYDFKNFTPKDFNKP